MAGSRCDSGRHTLGHIVWRGWLDGVRGTPTATARFNAGITRSDASLDRDRQAAACARWVLGRSRSRDTWYSSAAGGVAASLFDPGTRCAGEEGRLLHWLGDRIAAGADGSCRAPGLGREPEQG
jgi:hypothetical protein